MGPPACRLHPQLTRPLSVLDNTLRAMLQQLADAIFDQFTQQLKRRD